MERPRSIREFEGCYLGALAVGVANTAVHWRTYMAMPQVRQAQDMIGQWYLPAATVLGFAVPILLWYLVARRGSVVAKWIVTVFAGLGVFGLLSGMVIGSYASRIAAILGVTALVLNLIAVSSLFRADARAWFGEATDDAGGDRARGGPATW